MRFAVIGAGHFAQSAVMPAFSALRDEARLVGILSSDPEKRRILGEQRGLRTWSEAELPAALAENAFDALYIATPNHLHLAQATAALQAGVHVLLEKPMTIDIGEARRLRLVCQRSSASLMVAYRLHCDPLYVEAMELLRHGEIGEPRLFTASFTMQVQVDNVRTKARAGGGSVRDLGIYCINAARAVFANEPLEVRALAVGGHDRRSREVDEMTSVILRFPGNGLAVFTSSFGAASTSWLQVVGSKGSLCLDQAFDEQGEMELTIERNGRTRRRTAQIGDQVAGEIAYFVDCIRNGKDPEPGVDEGLRDLRVIDSILRAARSGSPQRLSVLPPISGPKRQQVRRKARASQTKSKLVNVESPSTDT